MRKFYKIGMMHAILLINTIVAMQAPIYQSYQRPWQQRVSQGWERTKEFTKRHKGKIAAAISVVAAVGLAFYAGDRLRKYVKKKYYDEAKDILIVHIQMPEDAKAQEGLILLGYLAKRGGLKDLQNYFNDPNKPQRKEALKKLFETYQNLPNALAYLAETSIENINGLVN